MSTDAGGGAAAAARRACSTRARRARTPRASARPRLVRVTAPRARSYGPVVERGSMRGIRGERCLLQHLNEGKRYFRNSFWWRYKNEEVCRSKGSELEKKILVKVFYLAPGLEP